jgi:hypothetical protein
MYLCVRQLANVALKKRANIGSSISIFPLGRGMTLKDSTIQIGNSGWLFLPSTFNHTFFTASVGSFLPEIERRGLSDWPSSVSTGKLF